ncbi:MAG: type II toxin-antitoxin system VapC family toxin [Novosphingobium sp.]|nr:type II toxin-antitoxin system VapC family toxin [Novosphingobium sp.]
MFVDACAIIALMSGEREAARVAQALDAADTCITSPVAVLETVLALARPDKFNRPVAEIEPAVLDFLDSRGIEILDLPPAEDLTRHSLFAADRFRSGRHGLNICDCLHYACAKHYRVPILATDDEFRRTDLETVD